jgi:hypothetical protein
MPRVSGIEVENPRTSKGHNLCSRAQFCVKLSSLESPRREEDDGAVEERI